jgi:hypothetical protein
MRKGRRIELLYYDTSETLDHKILYTFDDNGNEIIYRTMI